MQACHSSKPVAMQDSGTRADTMLAFLHKLACACVQLMWSNCTSLHVMFQPLSTVPLSRSSVYFAQSAVQVEQNTSFATKMYTSHNHLAGRERQKLCQECAEGHSGCLSNQLVPHTTPLCASPCRHTVSGSTVQNRQPHATGVLWGH